ncbi:hypothetical protein TNCV_628681 [Trichonephila clavipes]|nr:hypothetical protein TNCV_628681 [Trichonephila clavipes]
MPRFKTTQGLLRINSVIFNHGQVPIGHTGNPEFKLQHQANSLVYADKPQSLDHLEDNIRRVITDIRPHMLEKVIENWTSRLDYIRASRGSPTPEITLKM